MKLNRIAALAALAVCLAFGASAFVPVAYGCSGGLPGSCRDDGAQAIDTDWVFVWTAGRVLAGLFGG